MSELKFKYVRIHGKELAKNTMFGKGIFSMCWQLVRDDVMEQEDADLFKEIDDWFSTHLPWPPQCRNQEPVVCWFKTENQYQIAAKADGFLQIDELQESWSPEEVDENGFPKEK